MKDKALGRSIGQLKVKDSLFDETLGGSFVTAVIADYIVKTAKVDVSGNKRALGKVMSQAEKVKFILSANKDSPISIEGLDGDYDYSGSITRKEVEDMVEQSGYFKRSVDIVSQLLSANNLTANDVETFEVIGGGWRMPKIQEAILEWFSLHSNRTLLDKTLNGDESMCFGATMYAASLSSNFKLNFGVHDNNLFGISAHYKQLDSSSSDAAFKPEKSIPLFPRRSKLPSTKRVTLKTISDTIVSLSHDVQSDLPSNSVTVLERFNVTGASGTRFSLCPTVSFLTISCRRREEIPQWL